MLDHCLVLIQARAKEAGLAPGDVGQALALVGWD